jgi:two-component system NtrC family sensor kinase
VSSAGAGVPIATPTATAPTMTESSRTRSVATRVLLSYAIVTLVFSSVTGWGVLALRSASREAVLMRAGYLPLAVALRTTVASQDVWNTQLNHVTTAKNPADQRMWFELALKGGRPKTFGDLRAALSRAFSTKDEPLGEVGRELAAEATSIEQYLGADRELVAKLFEALHQRDERAAEGLREQLVTRGAEAKRRLSDLELRVERLVDALIGQARTRERLAIRLLAVLAALAVVIGVTLAFHTRKVLAPLGAVTERAKAVAKGDLTPRPVVASNDELGELAATFESMVTAISRANAELLASERLATIGKMAAHVTHEIRNPLSALALNVELLEEDVADKGAEGEALVRAVKNEVDRLTLVSERYLSVARRKPPRLEEEDIAELCQEAVTFVRPELERHEIRLQTAIGSDLPHLRVDEGQIKQVLHNLLRNAREATRAGGAVIVTVRAADDGGVDVIVDDEGEGIDEEARARLFEPFFTTKSHGTGLGLVVSREIVEAHRGSISAEARRPRGTRFVVHLPRETTPGSPGPLGREDETT